MEEVTKTRIEDAAEDKPDVGALLKLYERCGPAVDGWDRLRENERTRFCIWEGQSPDGKKWDKNLSEDESAFPWDGASDARINLADQIIGDIVPEETEAFWRAMAKVSSIKPSDAARAGYAQKVLQWVKSNKLAHELVDEVELASQYKSENGLAFVHVTWVRELGYKWKRVTLQEVIEAGVEYLLEQQQSAGQEQEGEEGRLPGGGQVAPAGQLPSPSFRAGEQGNAAGNIDQATVQMYAETVRTTLLSVPEEEGSVEFLQGLHERYVLNAIPEHFEEREAASELSVKQARRILKDLRKAGRADFPCPYVCRNEPMIRVLRPWEEVFVPRETTDVQNGPVFVKEFMTEADLESRGLADGWTRDFIEAAKLTKGHISSWQDTVPERPDGLQEMGATSVYAQSELIEILYAYEKKVDEDGVAGIFYTVLSANLGAARSTGKVGIDGDGGELYGKHELLDYKHGKMPFVCIRREALRRRLCATRGVPQIVSTDQRAEKVQMDAVTDRTSFEILPPILTPQLDGMDYKFGPAVQVPVARMENGPRFMEAPAKPSNLAFELMDRIQRRWDNYFGKRRGDEPPENAMLKKQAQVRRFLMGWSEVFQQVFWLMEQYLDPEVFMRITGADEPLTKSEEEIGQEFDYVLTFDVQELTPDFQQQKMEQISKILPEDSAGIIDRAKLVEWKVRSIDPAVADELVQSPGTASQALFKRVRDEFVSMFAGNPPDLVENDATAKAELDFAQQIIQTNPKYQQELQMGAGGPNGKPQPGSFAESVQKWMENRMFSVTQEKNKMVGRLGVNQDN